MKHVFHTTFLMFLILSSCSEPYDFNVTNESVDVVDGRISTAPSKSFISIYSISEEGFREWFPDLEVYVISEDSSRVDFYYDANTVSYRPVPPNFTAMIGSRYKMIATAADGRVYESGFDTVSEPVAFQVVLEDAFTQEFLPNLNRVVDVQGIAAVAVIPARTNDFYFKIDFRYFYENIFDVSFIESVFDTEAFALLRCDQELDCGKELRIPAGFKQTERPWKFRNRDISCDGENDCDILGIDCCDPCCKETILWEANYEISLKSMSLETYEYWENIQKLSQNDGLVFDVNPFPIEGNVACAGCNNRTVGIFRAYAETTAVVTAITE